ASTFAAVRREFDLLWPARRCNLRHGSLEDERFVNLDAGVADQTNDILAARPEHDRCLLVLLEDANFFAARQFPQIAADGRRSLVRDEVRVRHPLAVVPLG